MTKRQIDENEFQKTRIFNGNAYRVCPVWAADDATGGLFARRDDDCDDTGDDDGAPSDFEDDDDVVEFEDATRVCSDALLYANTLRKAYREGGKTDTEKTAAFWAKVEAFEPSSEVFDLVWSPDGVDVDDIVPMIIGTKRHPDVDDPRFREKARRFVKAADTREVRAIRADFREQVGMWRDVEDVDRDVVDFEGSGYEPVDIAGHALEVVGLTEPGPNGLGLSAAEAEYLGDIVATKYGVNESWTRSEVQKCILRADRDERLGRTVFLHSPTIGDDGWTRETLDVELLRWAKTSDLTFRVNNRRKGSRKVGAKEAFEVAMNDLAERLDYPEPIRWALGAAVADLRWMLARETLARIIREEIANKRAADNRPRRW
jgi:hypothetical protein